MNIGYMILLGNMLMVDGANRYHNVVNMNTGSQKNIILKEDGVNTSILVVITSSGLFNMTNLVLMLNLIVLLGDGAKPNKNVQTLKKHGSNPQVPIPMLTDGVKPNQFVVKKKYGKKISPTRLLVGVKNIILVMNVLKTNIG